MYLNITSSLKKQYPGIGLYPVIPVTIGAVAYMGLPNTLEARPGKSLALTSGFTG
jgi:hypothetical protein